MNNLKDMVWQDVVIGFANILFGYSLAFQIYRGFKDKKGYLALRAAFLTATGLFAMTLAFFTLDLFISTIVSFFNGAMWLILFIQGVIYKKY